MNELIVKSYCHSEFVPYGNGGREQSLFAVVACIVVEVV
jgi:hypothetical protein